QDHTVRVWDAGTGRPIGQAMRHEGPVYTASFSPDGKRIVSGSADKTARVWQAESGMAIGIPMLHNSYVNRASFSPDGKSIVTVCPGRFPNKVLSLLPFLASISESHATDPQAQIWNVSNSKALSNPLPHAGTIWSARFSPGGERILTASDDKTAQLWDAKSGKPVGEPMRHEQSV